MTTKLIEPILLNQEEFESLIKLKEHKSNIDELSKSIQEHDFYLYRKLVLPLQRNFGVIVCSNKKIELRQRITLISDQSKELEDLVISKALMLQQKGTSIANNEALDTCTSELLADGIDDQFSNHEFKFGLLTRILLCYAAILTSIRGNNETSQFIVSSLETSKNTPDELAHDQSEGALNNTERMILILLLQEHNLFPAFTSEIDRKDLYEFIGALTGSDSESIKKSISRALELLNEKGHVPPQAQAHRLKTLNKVSPYVDSLRNVSISRRLEALIEKYQPR